MANRILKNIAHLGNLFLRLFQSSIQLRIHEVQTWVASGHVAHIHSSFLESFKLA